MKKVNTAVITESGATPEESLMVFVLPGLYKILGPPHLKLTARGSFCSQKGESQLWTRVHRALPGLAMNGPR